MGKKSFLGVGIFPIIMFGYVYLPSGREANPKVGIQTVIADLHLAEIIGRHVNTKCNRNRKSL